MRLESGTSPIPGYLLTHLLGRGGFGEVWGAMDAVGHPVALKFLDCRTRSRSMISSEIRVLRGLSELHHPHIIQLISVSATSHYLVLVMEQADGNLADLRQAYQDEARVNVPLDHAMELLAQAAVALDFLAELRLPGFNTVTRGLQHCDIKPSNLLLVGEQLKIADFGLCAGTTWKAEASGWTGTPPYAAPELYHGQGVPGTDQYALAVTYCELRYGQEVLFPRPTSTAAPSGLVVDLRQVRAAEVSVLTRALHPQPSARWPTCKAFVDALRRAQAPSRHVRRLPSPCGR